MSQAAERLELSQSAISMSLAKLRKHFNDPLFVRTSAGMEPTPHAIGLINMLEKAEHLLQSALGHQIVFDPKISDRMFRLHSTDIAQVTLLPKLMRRLRSVAPAACLRSGQTRHGYAQITRIGRTRLGGGLLPADGRGLLPAEIIQGAVRLRGPKGPSTHRFHVEHQAIRSRIAPGDRDIGDRPYGSGEGG